MILHAQGAQDPLKKGVFWGLHQQNTVVAQPDLAAWGDGGTPQPPGRVGGRGALRACAQGPLGHLPQLLVGLCSEQ